MSTTRVFLSAGEASGDVYGAAFVHELRPLIAQGKEVHFEGICGPKMVAEGVEQHANSSHWGAISIVQALKIYPKVLNGYYAGKKKLSEGTPGLFIPIDFGYANIRLARHAKNRGWKVLYFIPPGSWRRYKQGGDLPVVTDEIVTPFSWSAEILNSMGASAHWYGHPIKQLIRNAQADVSTVRSKLAVLPGSRLHEIDANLPLIAEALKDVPSTIEFALAATIDAEAFMRQWKQLSGRDHDVYVVGHASRVLLGAKAAVVCSGTATLEAALSHCPMVVVYRLTEAMRREAKILRMKRPKFIALPNIVMDREIVPELVDHEATVEVVRGWVDKLMAESPERTQQLEDFEKLDELLGPADAITQAARLAERMITSV